MPVSVAKILFGICFNVFRATYSTLSKSVDFMLEIMWTRLTKLVSFNSSDFQYLSQGNNVPFVDEKMPEWRVHLAKTRDSREEIKLERWDQVLKDMEKLEKATSGFVESEENITLRCFLKFMGNVCEACKSAFFYAIAEMNHQCIQHTFDIVNNPSPQSATEPRQNIALNERNATTSQNQESTSESETESEQEVTR